MERAKKALKLPNQQFKRNIGTTKPVFQKMMRVLQAAYEKQHETGGKPPDLSVSDKLLITLQYYREYRTMEHIGIDYGCSKSSVSRSIHWVEQTLSADGQFQLPGKQALQDGTPKTVAVDVTEHPIHRPKKSCLVRVRIVVWFEYKHPRTVVFRQEKATYHQVTGHCRYRFPFDLRCQ